MAKRTGPPPQTDELQTLFYQGRFKEVLARSVDAPGGLTPEMPAAFVIASLAFAGRVDDALALFSRRAKPPLAVDEQALCRFALALGLVRLSRYEQAVAYLVDNLRASRRQQATDAQRFYAAQGLAAYRFFQCRYQSARRWAERAWTSALVANFPFGQMLAADMRGHALVRVGELSAGFAALDNAGRIAGQLHHAVHVGTVQAALANYKSLYGMATDDAVGALRRELAGLAPQDNHSQAAVQLELARLLGLRGEFDEADACLQAAARVVLVTGHRRQKALVRHALAYHRYLTGRFDEALEILVEAEATLDGRFDLQLLMIVLGLRLRIWEAMPEAERPSPEAIESLAGRVAALTAKTGDGVARNILWRDRGVGVPTLAGDDPLGDLRHLCARGPATPFADVAKILQSGMYGFLRYIVPFPVGARVLCLDLVPSELWIFDAGNVVRGDERISGLLKSLLLALARGPRSKRELVETLWGYEYHALRHDPLLYAVINRLRGALGARSAWLQAGAAAGSGVYALDPGVKVFVYEHREAAGMLVTARPEEERAVPSASLATPDSLNHRQLVILSELARERFVNASHCVSLFGVSRITATRDLTELTRLRLVKRIGKGRATVYSLR